MVSLLKHLPPSLVGVNPSSGFQPFRNIAARVFILLFIYNAIIEVVLVSLFSLIHLVSRDSSSSPHLTITHVECLVKNTPKTKYIKLMLQGLQYELQTSNTNEKFQIHFLNDVTMWRAHVLALINMNIIKSPFLHQCRLHSNGNDFKVVQKGFINSSSNLQETYHLGFTCQ